MSVGKQKCLCFLFTLSLFTCQIQARELKSFNKMSRPATSQTFLVDNIDKDKVPEPATALVSDTAATTEVVKGHGFGLYGSQQAAHDPPTATNPTQSTPEATSSATTTTNTLQKENEGISKDDVKFDEFEMTDAYLEGNSNNNAAHHNNNYNGYFSDHDEFKNNNGYVNHNQENYYNDNEKYRTQKEGMNDTRYLANGKYYHNVETEARNKYVDYNNGNTVAYNLKNGYVSQDSSNCYRNENYLTQRQGMSDTRYLAKGKYYYDLEGENNNRYIGYDQNDSSKMHNDNTKGYHITAKNKNNNYNDDSWAGKQGQGMGDTRLLNKGTYHYDMNEKNQNCYMITNGRYGFSGPQARGVSHSSSHEEEDQRAGEVGFRMNNADKKRPNEYDSIEEYEREEEKRLVRKYGNVP